MPECRARSSKFGIGIFTGFQLGQSGIRISAVMALPSLWKMKKSLSLDFDRSVQ
jgi:hypothetical protein